MQSRFLCTNSAADLNSAIDAARTARELVPRARPEARVVAVRLASLLAVRRRPDDEEEAFAALTAAQRTLRPGGGEHAALDFMIAAMLLPRHLRHRREEDLTAAVERLERAMPVLDREAARDRPNPQHTAMMAAAAGMVRLQLALAHTSRQSGGPIDEGNEQRIVALLAEAERLSPQMSSMTGMLHQVRELQRGLIQGEVADPLAMAEQLSIGDDGPFPGTSEMLANTTGAIRAGGRLGSSGDLQALDAQITALEAALADPDRYEPDPASPLVTLAQCYQLRARTKGLSDDPSAGADRLRAQELATEALAVGGGSQDQARLVLGACKLDGYRPDRPDPQALDEAVRLLRRGADGTSLSPAMRNAARIPLAEALLARGMLVGDLDEVEEALVLLATHRDRLPPTSLQHAVASSRVAAALHVRAEATGSTEDLLHAADASRRATAAIGELSLVWAYDTALYWAEWSWRHGRSADAAEAYLLTLRTLNQLARAQLSRAYGELVLRRRTRGLVGRAAHALTRRRRLPEAAVALESGRAVLLSAALERDLVGLTSPEHAPVRERYRRAVDRLTTLEDRALSEASTREEQA
uniref:Uncharacterized protein n=1 Tax=Micromonospora carbonacea TaxID=47853 RepID=A0A7D6CEM2_9ACTN|nr:hypothetical protein HZU44_17390 [Micromonospora carbonacea]